MYTEYFIREISNKYDLITYEWCFFCIIIIFILYPLFNYIVTITIIAQVHSALLSFITQFSYEYVRNM